MKRPETVSRMAHWCDNCGKKADGTGCYIDGFYYARCCDNIAHNIWCKERVIYEIKSQPFFGEMK